MEQHTKQRAGNADSTGDIDNNGKRRPRPTEESMDMRPGAHAVSIDGEECRRTAQQRGRSIDYKLSLLDAALGIDPSPTSAAPRISEGVPQSAGIDMSGRLNENGEEIVHNPTDSDGVHLQAVIVNEENPEVEAIRAENERLRQSMIAENRRRRQEMENQDHHLGREIIEATPDDDTGEDEKKQRRRKLATFLCLLLALAAGAIGAVFASKLTADDASLKNLSDEPASSTPSSPPTITMLYDPPSEEDCLAVENGGAVTGQDTMITITLDVGLEIVLNKDIAQNEWMDQLLQSILAHLIPYLVGCTDDRNPSVGNRYVFGNGNATIDYDDAETCEKETDLPCYPVAVYLDLKVKDDENLGSLISLLETLIGSDGSEDSLADRLHLSDDFNEVVLEGITSQSPTSFPSSARTDMPSLYPSTVHSSLPSLSSFSPLPTLSPVVSITTSAPTKAPTVSPSPSAPTTLRSPTRMPTRAPALGPTDKPSKAPSSAPVAAQTEPPTGFPTESPSKSPSSFPISLPTPVPTAPPSLGTPSPTAQTEPPTGFPTESPSKSPSSVPSPLPTSAPTAPLLATPSPTALPLTGPPTRGPTPNPPPVPNPTASTPTLRRPRTAARLTLRSATLRTHGVMETKNNVMNATEITLYKAAALSQRLPSGESVPTMWMAVVHRYDV